MEHSNNAVRNRERHDKMSKKSIFIGASFVHCCVFKLSTELWIEMFKIHAFRRSISGAPGITWDRGNRCPSNSCNGNFLAGIVMNDDGNPVAEALFTFEETADEAKADDKWQYRIPLDKIPSGIIEVRLKKA